MTLYRISSLSLLQSCVLANLVGDVNHCSVVEYGECVDIEKRVIVRGWIVVLRSDSDSFISADKEKSAPLSRIH